MVGEAKGLSYLEYIHGPIICAVVSLMLIVQLYIYTSAAAPQGRSLVGFEM